MKFPIGNHLECELDNSRDDCRREAPHCHITRNGIRVAQVWLVPYVYFKRGFLLERNEINLVLEAVSAKRYDLLQKYRSNAGD